MTQVSDRIIAFFEEFNQANNAFDANRLDTIMSDPLVAGDPHGAVVTLKKDDYLAGVVESQAYLSSLGFQFVKVVPIEEIALSECYMLVKTQGIMRLEKESGESIDLVHNPSYILFTKEDSIRIVFSLSHEDPMKMAQDQGFLPSP